MEGYVRRKLARVSTGSFHSNDLLARASQRPRQRIVGAKLNFAVAEGRSSLTTYCFA